MPAAVLACLLGGLFAASGCERRTGAPPAASAGATTRPAAADTNPVADTAPTGRAARDYRAVHVFVCLADNRHQGIVRVPAALGNGQNPAGNLYWGAMYGVKTYLVRSGHWTAMATPRPARKGVLERAVFLANRTQPPLYVVADAYDGARMDSALGDFLAAAGGRLSATVPVRIADRTVRVHAGGRSDLVCFVGHNGLMDAPTPDVPESPGRGNPAAAVVLACRSQAFFAGPLRRARCRPLITTTGLMAPEAYTLDAILRAWAAGRTPARIRDAAAAAYAKYQKCPVAAARRLFHVGQ